jgi:hypothetical protein
VVVSRTFPGTPFIAVTRFATATQPPDRTIATMRRTPDAGSTWLEAWTADLEGPDAGLPTFSGFTVVPEALASNAMGTTVIAAASATIGGGPPTWDTLLVNPLANFSTGARQGIALQPIADYRFSRLRVLELAPDAGAAVIALLERRTAPFEGRLHRAAPGSPNLTFAGNVSFAADDVVEIPGNDALAVGFRCHTTCSAGATIGLASSASVWTTTVPFDPALSTLGSPTSLLGSAAGPSGLAGHRLVATPSTLVLAGQAQGSPTQLFVEKRTLAGLSQGSTTSTGPLRIVDAIPGPDADTVLLLAAATGPGTFGAQTISHAGTLSDVVLIVLSASTSSVRVQAFPLPGDQLPVAMAWTNVAGIVPQSRLVIVGNEGPQGTDGFMWLLPL